MKTNSIIRLGELANNGAVARSIPAKSAPRNQRDGAYPDGSIGADVPKRDYIKYLVDRYRRLKGAEKGFGVDDQRFNYAVIYRNIESAFKTQTFFVPVERFGDLAVFLGARIDRTVLGRRNKARGISNFTSFEEYQEKHMAGGTAVAQ